MKNELSKNQIETKWNTIARTMLKGKKIVDARYLTVDEMENLGWQCRSVVIFLDDGTQIFPAADDEGNDAGAMFTNNEKFDTLPVLWS